MTDCPHGWDIDSCQYRECINARAKAAEDAPSRPTRRLRLLRADQVIPKRAAWLWQTEDTFGRIPLGEVSIAAGRGNVGKSPFCLWLAARLTRGDLPGELFGTPVNVLIYASEDSHEHTTVPRLLAAGADMSRVHLIVGTETDEDADQPLAWSADLPLIESAINTTGARLLVIDPLVDVRKRGANAHSTDDWREALAPIVAMVHRTTCSAVGIAHFNKGKTGDVADLLSGAHGLRDIVRAVLAFVKGENDEMVLGQDKNNLGRSGDDVPRLTYRMASVNVDIDGWPVSQPAFEITGTTDSTLSELLIGSRETEAVPNDIEWLFQFVAAEHPSPVAAKKCAIEAESRGLRWDTVTKKARKTGLFTARQELGAIASWVWGLSDSGALRAGKAPVEGSAA